MAVFLTGDTHGEIDFAKVKAFAQVAGTLTLDDYLVILGDFGLVWSDPPTDGERSHLDWLEAQNWTTLFVDGNHENFDRLSGAYPELDFHGGRAHMIRGNVFHLMRGHLFNLDGVSVFVFGGARSHDISGGILRPWEYQTEGEFKAACKS